MAKIKILNGDETTQKLQLSDHGHSWVPKGRRVIWKIAEDSNVASIQNIVVNRGAEIFSELPARKKSKWKAKIAQGANDYAQCKYSIFWNATDGTGPYEYDPKISVKPSAISALPIIIAVVSFVSLILLFGKISKR